ncbi:dioxygenase [Oculatella sp. LEGE 06141]|uniref:DODA-type extradiol aromatic ring-opening family dioxygenase n=1 Tax=Oculatella sp. LEGE 06141 TaxID=1828648 RepID=UPI00187E199D|nr:class III extradiol ring-cleavage dioxygenase [Oculatella sp. LEGE 06141]MBE9182838.1 dioxygenase [Oculatella sp. LEGE 06141]
MPTFPSLFISHGSPDLPLKPSQAQRFLQQLGNELGKPRAILVISAHWLSQIPTVSTASPLQTIHDFRGFPPELYQLTYPAPGAPELAASVQELLQQAGMACEVDADRGLDHGAWNPLMLMYPDAEIPVTQLSLQPKLGTAHHVRLGEAIASLRQAGVLILASGAATHNLQAFGKYDLNAPPPTWVTEFDQWLARAIAANDIESLLNYRHSAPHAVRNHPSEEHLLPLFVAIGAGGAKAPGIQLHSSFTYGAFSMAAYAFGNALQTVERTPIAEIIAT